MSTADHSQYMTTRQLAQRLGIRVRSLYARLYRGTLPQPVEVLDRKLWPVETIEKWLSEQRPKTSPDAGNSPA